MNVATSSATAFAVSALLRLAPLQAKAARQLAIALRKKATELEKSAPHQVAKLHKLEEEVEAQEGEPASLTRQVEEAKGEAQRGAACGTRIHLTTHFWAQHSPAARPYRWQGFQTDQLEKLAKACKGAVGGTDRWSNAERSCLPSCILQGLEKFLSVVCT